MLVAVLALLTLWVEVAWATPTPVGSAVPVAADASAEVRLSDEVVFSVQGRGNQTAQARASEITGALNDAVKLESGTVRIAPLRGAQVIYVGDLPIVELSAEDAKAANAASVEVHASSIAAKIKAALEAERQRSKIAETVFSISLVVFLGLLALFVLRKSGDLEHNARTRLEQNADRVVALKVSSFEVLGKGATRVLILVFLSVAKWLLRGAVIYTYLVVVTTLFEPTRGVAEQLTRGVVTPISALAGRLAASLPVVVVVLFAAATVVLLLRLSALFFSSISSGETSVQFIKRDMAEALGGLTSVSVVVLALVFAAPVVTGDREGAFARVGTHLLLALALGAAPILASAGLGALLVLRRHVRHGDRIKLAKIAGKIQHFGLIDLVLEDARGDRVRIPYLVALLSPLFVQSPNRVFVTLCVSARVSQQRVIDVLREALAKFDPAASVTLEGIDITGAHYLLGAPSSAHDTRERLLLAASEALLSAAIPLAGPTLTAAETAP